MRWFKFQAMAGLAVLAVVGPARAGMFDHVLDDLRFAGFAIDSSHSNLSNSDVAIIAHNFQGNLIDTGDFNFGVAGPVSMVLERGGRGIPELSLTLSSGLLNINPNRVVQVGAPQPLSYTFNFDTGTTDTTVTGNALFDLRAKINKFGSYDLRFQASNRQTTSINGRFEDVSQGSADFDLGPIDIEGNVFADLLATVTDPFFAAAGVDNIFADFSGRTFRESQARTTVEALRKKVEAGGTLTDEELATLGTLKTVSSLLGDELPSLTFIQNGLPAGISATSVPEPTTGLLMLAGGVALMSRRRRGV